MSTRVELRVDGNEIARVYMEIVPQVGNFVAKDGEEYEVKRVLLQAGRGRPVVDLAPVVVEKPKPQIKKRSSFLPIKEDDESSASPAVQ